VGVTPAVAGAIKVKTRARVYGQAHQITIPS